MVKRKRRTLLLTDISGLAVILLGAYLWTLSDLSLHSWLSLGVMGLGAIILGLSEL